MIQEVNKNFWYRTRICLENRGYYYHPTSTKLQVCVPTKFAECIQNMKQSGYKQQLEYEIDNCLKHNGRVFLGALTYNEINVPYYEINGQRFNVWDNRQCYQWKDYICKFFRRVYNYQVKVMCIPEGGEGGETHIKDGYQKNDKTRGKDNNPHWHTVLCFYPLEGAYPINYKIVNHMHQYYWQTQRKVSRVLDENGDEITPDDPMYVFKRFEIAPWVDPTTIGRAELSSKNGGEVIQSGVGTAAGYLTGYSTKDINDFRRERQIVANLAWYHYNTLYESMLYDGDLQDEFITNFSETGLDYEEWIRTKCKIQLDEACHQYRRDYGYKVICSQHFGECALQHIEDGRLPMRGEHGMEYVELGPYLYRKHFYDKVERLDREGKKKLYSYVINNNYISYEIKHFDEKMEDAFNKNKSVWSKFTQDSLVDEFVAEYGDLVNLDSFYTRMSSMNDDILYSYTIYNKVYKGRHYVRRDEDGNKLIPVLEPKIDYYNALIWRKNVYYCDVKFNYFMEMNGSEYESYSHHPEFEPYMNHFYYLDLWNQFISEKTIHYWREQKQSEKQSGVRVKPNSIKRN